MTLYEYIDGELDVYLYVVPNRLKVEEDDKVYADFVTVSEECRLDLEVEPEEAAILGLARMGYAVLELTSFHIS